MMKIIAAAIISGFTASVAIQAQAQGISVPYFKKLSNSDVCGGFNAHCQPTSSSNYDLVRGADFADVGEWLGTSYGNGGKAVFQRSACTTPIALTDVTTSGKNNFSAVVDNAYAGALRSKLDADIATYLGVILQTLPVPLAAKLKADATDSLIQGSGGKASFTYQRYDIKFAKVGDLLPGCYAKTGGKRKVITGVSVVSMSGSWARNRILDSFGAFEATAAFIGLAPDIKANYTDQRKKALEGSFEPMSFVIATTWRKQD